MRLGPIFAAAALAALLAGCNKSQPQAPSGSQPAAAPAPALSDADKQKLLAALPAPYNTADLANGEAKFALCQSCHTLNQGGANMTGPNLYGVLGTKAGEGHEGFKFSDQLKASGIVWTPEKLDPWITKPQDVVPGSKMTFAGLSEAKDRADLIAYLMVQTGYKPQ
jgi:cytochrome c